MSACEHTYALILAGGSGTRFWPLSRDARPKQLLDLFGDGTLLEQTIRRLDGLVPLEQILILTNEKQLDAVRAAAADAAAGKHHRRARETRHRARRRARHRPRSPRAIREAIMMVLPADQLIRDHEAYLGR